MFVKLMRLYAEYHEVEVLSFVVMDNHFHLLLEVPPKKKGATVPMSDEVFLEKVKAFCSKAYYVDVKQTLIRLREGADSGTIGADSAAEELKARHTCRMKDLSCFMQGLKRRFTQWFNKTHDRTGTLWEGRFKSILVEDGFAARVISCYIDLNSIRAGMVERPEDYRWSSYGSAMCPMNNDDRTLARGGLCRVMQLDQETGGRVSPEQSSVTWEEQGALWYRMMLFSDGEAVFISRPEQGIEQVQIRQGFKREDVEAVLARGGKLSFGEALRCRIRYLSDGMVFGSLDFVNWAFQESREYFTEKRKTGARTIRGVGWKNRSGRLYSMRALSKKALE